jgi:hypothetical protein
MSLFDALFCERELFACINLMTLTLCGQQRIYCIMVEGRKKFEEMCPKYMEHQEQQRALFRAAFVSTFCQVLIHSRTNLSLSLFI